MDIDPLISKYQDQLNAIDRYNAAMLGEKESLSKTLNKLKQDYAEKSFVMKCFSIVPFSFKRWSLEDKLHSNKSKLRKIPARQKSALRELVLECGRALMTSDDGCDFLAQMESEHFKLCSLLESTRSIRSAGSRALDAITSALDSVSSAQTMEILDAVSDNKAISTLSTLENMSVSEAVREARSAVEAFQIGLKNHQNIVSTLEHSTTIEIVDFVFDFSFGGLADTIGSVLSYLALSETESNLDRAKAEVEKALSPIAEQYSTIKSRVKSHEAELLTYKTSARARVVHLLLQRGISVPDGFIDTLKDLYAPSAKAAGGSQK